MTPFGARQWAQSVGLQLKYEADLSRLAALDAPFVRLDVDSGTARYIGHAETHRHGRVMTWLHRRLRGLLSDFDINGLLGTYPMHVLSTNQWRTLLPEEAGGRLLDVGAGRGDVTEKLAPLFDEVVTTETSRAMARRLQRLGYRCWSGDLVEMADSDVFDAVSLLNVLDRCERPLSLLSSARMRLRPGGLLIVALVVPYQPFVYDQGQSRPPRERLPISSPDFEQAAVEFVSMALDALALETICVSRTPYLSGGDAHHPMYELDDLVVVARALGEPPPILGGR